MRNKYSKCWIPQGAPPAPSPETTVASSMGRRSTFRRVRRPCVQSFIHPPLCSRSIYPWFFFVSAPNWLTVHRCHLREYWYTREFQAQPLAQKTAACRPSCSKLSSPNNCCKFHPDISNRFRNIKYICKGYQARIAVNGIPKTELRDVTCHMGSRCYLPATRHKWTRPALTQARRPVLDLPTAEGRKADLT